MTIPARTRPSLFGPTRRRTSMPELGIGVFRFAFIRERGRIPNVRTACRTPFAWRTPTAVRCPIWNPAWAWLGMPSPSAPTSQCLRTFTPAAQPRCPLALVQGAQRSDPLPMHHNGMMSPQPSVPPELTFPYAFPSAGRYRIFVQIRRAGRVQTGCLTQMWNSFCLRRLLRLLRPEQAPRFRRHPEDALRRVPQYRRLTQVRHLPQVARVRHTLSAF